MVRELVGSNYKGVSESERVRYVSLHKHEHKKRVGVSVHLSSVSSVHCRAQPQTVQFSE